MKKKRIGRTNILGTYPLLESVKRNSVAHLFSWCAKFLPCVKNGQDSKSDEQKCVENNDRQFQKKPQIFEIRHLENKACTMQVYIESILKLRISM